MTTTKIIGLLLIIAGIALGYIGSAKIADNTIWSGIINQRHLGCRAALGFVGRIANPRDWKKFLSCTVIARHEAISCRLD